LVQAELDSGAPLAVAGQRVLQKYGARAIAPRIEKARTTANDFMTLVNAMMGEKKLSRTAAMQEARKRHPDLFAAYQSAWTLSHEARSFQVACRFLHQSCQIAKRLSGIRYPAASNTALFETCRT